MDERKLHQSKKLSSESSETQMDDCQVVRFHKSPNRRQKKPSNQRQILKSKPRDQVRRVFSPIAIRFFSNKFWANQHPPSWRPLHHRMHQESTRSPCRRVSMPEPILSAGLWIFSRFHRAHNVKESHKITIWTSFCLAARQIQRRRATVGSSAR